MRDLALVELMPVDIQTVSIGFGPGVDTKTDPKASAKPILIYDGIYTDPHRISKRPGNDSFSASIVGGGSISSPTMNRTYKNELVLAATTSGGSNNGKRLFGYSSEIPGWVDKGKYVSVAVGKQEIQGAQLNEVSTGDFVEFLGSINSSGAILNGVIAYAYDQALNPNASATGASVFWDLRDQKTGNRIASQQITSAYGYTWGFSKIIALGSTCFAILYVSDTDPSNVTAPKLCLRTITASLSGIAVGSEVQIASISNQGTYCYDAVTTSGGAIVALCAPNGSPAHALALYAVNTSGSPSSPTNIVTTNNSLIPISIALDPAGTNAWIYWVDEGVTLKYAIYNASTLGSVLAATTAQTSLSSYQPAQITALPSSATQQKCYFSTYQTPASSLTTGVFYPSISQISLTSTGGGVGTASSFLPGADIYSRPFSVSGANYMGVVTFSPTSPSGFIVDLSDGVAVAKFLQGRAEGLYAQGANLSGNSTVAPYLIAARWSGFINSPMSLGSSIYGFASGFSVQVQTYAPTTTTSLSAFPPVVSFSAQMGVCLSTFDFQNQDAYQALVQQDTLVLNGGVVSQYDGAQVSELGFNIDPDCFAIKCTTGGSGAISAGQYAYSIVLSWTDALGNLHQSAPSIPLIAFFASGVTTGNVEIGFAGLVLTQKSNVFVNIYKTAAGGTIANLIASIPNPGASFNTAYTDIGAFNPLVGDSQPLYTDGGAILENIAPPPTMIMWTNNNRIWGIDSENPETNIEPSKTASQGSGIAFSTGQLTIVIDSKGGAITGASPMDEKTVILKESGAGYFIGDAANDAGGGETISNFQFIPSTTGCSNSKSVVLYNDGILFRASNNKGIYKVSRGGQIGYFGLDVEAYNSQDIQSAVNIPNKTQIRFLTSSGYSLLYDYVMNQWSAFSNFAGLSADQFNGLYVYVRSSNNAQDNGAVFIEDESSYLDNATPYAPAILLQWIKSSSIQNFQRVRRIEMLGDYQNGTSVGHGVQISAAYNFGTTFSAPVPYYFGTSSSSGYFQYRQILKQQKCGAVQFLIQEIVTGASGEFIDFTDLGLEIATKKGLNKLPGYRSVG